MATGSYLVLVAVDFEQASLHALDTAKELGQRLGAEIVLVHVYQLPVYTYPGLEPALVPGFHTEVMTAALRALEQLAQSAGGLRSVLREGDAAREIIAAANDEKASMIVMGTHGRRGLSHLFLGSVAEKVVRDSSIPVLTVKST